MTKEDARLIPLASVGLAVGVFNEFIRPNPAMTFWAGLGASVMAYEAFCPTGQLLSEAAHRAVDKHPLLVRAAIGVTALHLMRALPQAADPWHQLTRFK